MLMSSLDAANGSPEVGLRLTLVTTHGAASASSSRQ
jgi:hypothetical protein